jgi:hypothetical protein
MVKRREFLLNTGGGRGTLRHIWMTLGSWPPEVMRALRLEVFYDGLLPVEANPKPFSEDAPDQGAIRLKKHWDQ